MRSPSTCGGTTPTFGAQPDDRRPARPSSRGLRSRRHTGDAAEAMLDASFFERPRRHGRLPGGGPRAGRPARGLHRHRRDGRAVFVRREVPLAPAALPLHPAVAHRLLRRQERRQRRLPDRRSRAALRAFQREALLFSAPHNAVETRYPRVTSWAEVRELFARLDGARDAEQGPAGILPLAAAARTQPVTLLLPLC